MFSVVMFIECGGEIMPTNIITKFDTPSLMMVHWNPFKLQSGHGLFYAILANLRAITTKCFMGSGWLLNLAEIFCQQTFSQSLMIIQWKLF